MIGPCDGKLGSIGGLFAQHPRMAIANTLTTPFTGGWPLIGQTFSYRRDAYDFYWRVYRQYGEVSRSSLLFRQVYNLLGPDANELVLLNQGGNFKSQPAWEELLQALFPGGLMLRDGAEHKMHRRLMQGAFSHESLRGYHTMMDARIATTLDQWPIERPVPFLALIKQLTLDVATQVFMGEQSGLVAADLQDDFVSMVDASVAIVRLNLPGLPYGQGLAARRRMVRYFQERVAAKRRSAETDLFARLAQAKDETGQHFSDEEVVNHMIFMMMAAHDTTTSTLTSVIRCLAENPHWQRSLREEALAAAQPLSFDGLSGLTLTDLVMKEALRMYPPVPTLPRLASEPFEFKGHLIPGQSLVALSPLISHYLPDIWTEPAKFDPERFAPNRAEDRRHRFAWVPFGGGVHKCIGMHFADNQIKLVLHHLLTRFEWQLAAPQASRVDWIPICHPVDGLPVILRNRSRT